MSIMRYPNKVLERAPRALVLAERLAEQADRRTQPTPRSVEPLMGLYASGQLPVDAMAKRAIEGYLQGTWRKLQGVGPPTEE